MPDGALPEMKPLFSSFMGMGAEGGSFQHELDVSNQLDSLETRASTPLCIGLQEKRERLHAGLLTYCVVTSE